VNASLVNCEPWSKLKILGLPNRACSATIRMRSVLPHPGMLPNGPSIASPECSRRCVTLSIGVRWIVLEVRHMLATAMMNLRARTTRRQAAAGSHHRARSSASPPVPRGDRNLAISGLQISRGFGGSAPMLSARSRRAIRLRALRNDGWPYKQASV
jgi:hypothetical protein